jgi:hypothetical protein
MQNHDKVQQLAKGVWEHDIRVDVFNLLNTTLTSLLRTYKKCFYIYVTIYLFLKRVFFRKWLQPTQKTEWN